MSVAAGFFVDWDGNVHSTLAPGGGYLCATGVSARYMAIATPSGALVHEASFYKTLDDLDKAGYPGCIGPRIPSMGKSTRRILTRDPG